MASDRLADGGVQRHGRLFNGDDGSHNLHEHWKRLYLKGRNRKVGTCFVVYGLQTMMLFRVLTSGLVFARLYKITYMHGIFPLGNGI
jgi:hypothetical protein